MGRDHVWKGKDPAFRRLLEEVAAEAERLRVKGQGWRGDGLGDWTLSRVLWRLAELGLSCTKEESFAEAFVYDSPYSLASFWSLRLRAEGELREFLEYAAEVVCGWHFSNGGAPEADFLLAADFAIEDECREEKLDEEQLRRRVEAAIRIPKVASISRPDDPGGWVTMMEERCRVPVSMWVAELLMPLGVNKLADAAIALAEAWAPIALTERFRAELPLLLMVAGKPAEGQQRARDLIRDYPRSVPALFNAGKALIALGSAREGTEVVQRAMAFSQSREERLWIREHLDSLAAALDQDDDAHAPRVFDDDATRDDEEAGEPIVAEARVGRNDPCPCGSGKKYKKCCAKGGA
ncbi:MAG: SEC-C metal-binding domain-containing protein [Planctomycetota bacterium]